MRFNKKWIDTWVPNTLSADELSDMITMAGLEVDTVSPVCGEFDKVVVGKVVECFNHPDSDHLHVTKVDAGTGELLQIVCGAPNCREGLKVHDLYAYNYTKLQQVYPTNKYDAEIVLLIIDPKLQGKGLGRKLIDFAIKKVRKEGAQNVFLLTDTSCNYKFYDLLMFKQVAKRKGGYLYEGQESPEYFFVYEKNL